MHCPCGGTQAADEINGEVKARKARYYPGYHFWDRGKPFVPNQLPRCRRQPWRALGAGFTCARANVAEDQTNLDRQFEVARTPAFLRIRCAEATP